LKNSTSGHIEVNWFGAISTPFIARWAQKIAIITADTALRLSKAFGTTAQMWLNLQNSYDMRVAKQEIGKELAGIERLGPNKAA
jgi:antitoxin HigA-1